MFGWVVHGANWFAKLFQNEVSDLLVRIYTHSWFSVRWCILVFHFSPPTRPGLKRIPLCLCCELLYTDTLLLAQNVNSDNPYYWHLCTNSEGQHYWHFVSIMVGRTIGTWHEVSIVVTLSNEGGDYRIAPQASGRNFMGGRGFWFSVVTCHQLDRKLWGWE